MEYLVKLSSKDENDDVQYLDITLTATDETDAVEKAIQYYYSEYWTNTNWNKDKFNDEMNKFKLKLSELESDLIVKGSLDKKLLSLIYESDLRKHLGATDKSLLEFSELSLLMKLDYLSDIGCELNYFVCPKKTRFEKITIK